MSLENLLKIGQLERHQSSARQIDRLLTAAIRCIHDAKETSISPETRLEAAYRAITHLSMLALWANGYRPSSRAGHHMTMIQSLIHSMELKPGQVYLLDTFRVKRNATSYSGEDVDSNSVEQCIGAAEDLLRNTNTWLAEHGYGPIS